MTKRLLHTPPETGGFYAWKWACYYNNAVLIRLYIPAEAKRLKGNEFNRKCRASEAKVVSFHKHPRYRHVDVKAIKSVRSHWDSLFRYRRGRTVRPDWFDESAAVCSHGIHFFMLRRDAERGYWPQ